MDAMLSMGRMADTTPQLSARAQSMISGKQADGPTCAPPARRQKNSKRCS